MKARFIGFVITAIALATLSLVAVVHIPDAWTHMIYKTTSFHTNLNLAVASIAYLFVIFLFTIIPIVLVFHAWKYFICDYVNARKDIIARLDEMFEYVSDMEDNLAKITENHGNALKMFKEGLLDLNTRMETAENRRLTYDGFFMKVSLNMTKNLEVLEKMAIKLHQLEDQLEMAQPKPKPVEKGKIKVRKPKATPES